MVETRKQGIVYNKPSEGSWNVPGVSYRGETGTYRVFEQMTPALNQDRLAEIYEREKPKENPHPIDSILHFAILSAAYNLRNQNKQEAKGLRDFLQKGFRIYPNTITRVNSPNENDEVVHNYNTSEQYSLTGNVVRHGNWMSELSDKKVLELLLGTKDVDEINKVFQWINKTNGYLWRLNSKPFEKQERVVGFDAYPDRLLLSCDRPPLDGYPAFRVLRVE